MKIDMINRNRRILHAGDTCGFTVPIYSCNGVGPREMVDLKWETVNSDPWERPILIFSGSKRGLFEKQMARAKRHYIPVNKLSWPDPNALKNRLYC